MSFVIKKAERKQARLRLGLCGPSGSGKTYSALRLAKGLVAEGECIGLIDTERKSASLYADNPTLQVDFDVIEMEPPYSPERYRQALHAMEQAGYAVIIIDQISHAWSGEGGLLEYVDTLKSQSRNALSPWMQATPEQNRFVDSILRSPSHIIATMRAKSEWLIEDQTVKGVTKKVPRKIGLAPVQRDGIEYEFTTMLDLDLLGNTATASKDRSGLFSGIVAKLDEDWGKKLRTWLESGTTDSAPSGNGHAKPALITPEMRKKLGETAKGREIPTEIASAIVQGFGFAKTQDITVDKFNDVMTALCDWKAPEPTDAQINIAGETAECHGEEADYERQQEYVQPQPETKNIAQRAGEIARQMTEKESLAEKRKEVDSFGQQLLNAGVPMHEISSLIESGACVRESRLIENTFDANVVLSKLETRLEQAQAQKKAAAKKSK